MNVMVSSFPLLVLKESEAKLLAEAKLAMNKLHISIHDFSLIILRFFISVSANILIID